MWCLCWISFLSTVTSTKMYMAICHEQRPHVCLWCVKTFFYCFFYNDFKTVIIQAVLCIMYSTSFLLDTLLLGKSSQLYSHSLTALFEHQAHVQRKPSHLSLSTNRFTDRIIHRYIQSLLTIPFICMTK